MNLFLLNILLFFAGLAENGINGWHMRAVSHSQKFQSFISGVVYVMIWMTALRSIVENITVWWLVFSYALGSGVGSWLIVSYATRNKGRTNESEESHDCSHLHRR